MKLLRDIFLHLVKVLIAPLVFVSIVQGIAASAIWAHRPDWKGRPRSTSF